MNPYEIIKKQMDFLYEQGRKLGQGNTRSTDRKPAQGAKNEPQGISQKEYNLLNDEE